MRTALNIVQHVLGLALAILYVVGAFLVVNNVITWKMIFPLFS